ncbi:hypothetical protein [Calothrix sp. PCC 6303]|uniref:hypothetical protein n=1 Tax=Calothrix sp. PCC 6303 TaxID=1170562 RepID=UPI0002A00296|nr:hypothetical protein [Calothrix sp. PCC 6303]AFY99370.1 hypothetical protein Cal6303_0273 [Calothrix sp. PCC 6303]
MRKQVISIAILVSFGLLYTARPSHALNLKKLFDPILKRGVCAVIGVNTGECASERQNSPSPNYSSPNYPQYPEQPLNNSNQADEYPQYMPPNPEVPYGYPQYTSPNPEEQ